MEYILIAGMLLVICWISWLEYQRKQQPKPVFDSELIYQKLDALNKRLGKLEGDFLSLVVQMESPSSPDPLSAQGLEHYKEIQAAWQQGEDITDISRRFGLLRGEVELIINLVRKGGDKIE